MKFKTAITQIKDGEELIRGQALLDRATGKSFVENLVFLLTGKELSEDESAMINMILSVVIDHGPGSGSAMTARISTASKNPTHASLAAGLLGLGQRHGLAVTPAMEFFYANKEVEDIGAVVKEMKENKQRVPGFGHPFFTDHDPRSRALFQFATDKGIYGEYCVFALGVHGALNEISSKQLPMNVDGAIAAILCDMGFDAALGNILFMIGRVPGLLSQIYEEQTNDVGYRRTAPEDIEFVG